jgi:hypothetical protein
VALSFPRSPIGAGVPARAAALAAGVLLAALSTAFLLWALLTRSAAQFAWLTSLSNIIAVFLAGTATAASLLAWSRRSGGKTEPDSLRPRLVSLAEADPFALEVKRSLEADAARGQMPALTPYVRRDHDTRLEELARAAARGESQVAVVYGESSTGKTRACWEMLAPLRAASPAWRLWHPIDPTPSGALVAGLPLIGPRTVIWLNEARAYLNTPDEAGEKAAAALRELTGDPSRGPVLVIATLWPGDWRALTEQPRQPDDADRHSQARELLAGRGHRVPAEFTPADPDELKRQSAADPRLAEAVSRAPGRKVIQYLAGVPLLMDRYDSASTPARALIHAAMDARRMGHGTALPVELLANAAPGYMPGDDPDLYGGSAWLAAALADASGPLASGIAGPLTLVRARARHRRGQKPDQGTPPETGEYYQLAEYLDQHGRRERHDIVPPPAFWDAALSTTAADLVALAYSARRRGLVRTAVLLSKQAAPQSAWAAGELVGIMSRVCPGDQRPARWSAVHAPVSQTDGIANLINAVWELAGVRSLAPLLARGPAARASLGDPRAVANLIYALEQAGAAEQAESLAARAARHTALSRPYAVADLLGHLNEQGKTLRAAAVHAAVLAERAARDAPLDDPRAVAALLDALHQMNAGELAAILLSRDPACHAALTAPASVAALLGALHKAGAREQAAALADRIARESPLIQPATAAGLLGILLESGDQRHASTLLSRDPASQADIRDPRSVAGLLRLMQKAGADGQVSILARRASRGTALDDPGGTADLLATLHRAGAQEPASAVAGRASREASLSEPQGIVALLDAVREAGTGDDGSLLLRRAVENCPRMPSSVPWLVNWLWDNSSPEQALHLAARGSADVPAGDLLTVLNMLVVLRRIQGHEQAAALLARDPASRVVLDTAHQADANYLLSELRKAGAAEQASILTGRLPTGGLIDLFLSQDQNRGQYPFGREQDGNPAPPWDWDSLCQ